MSNEQRYVRILPSAVESNLGRWYEHHVGAVLPIHHMSKHNDVEVYILYSPMFSTNTYMIEVYHTKEVYVYDEPRGVVNNDTLTDPSQPTAKPMKVRVVKAGKGSWYETQVGEEFNVLEERKSDYIVEKVGDTWYHIDKSDCEIVTEPELMEPYYPNKLFKAAKTNKNVAMHLKEAATHAHLFDLAAQFRHYEKALPSDQQQTEADGYDKLLAEFNKPSGRTAAEYVGGDEPDPTDQRIAELEARVKALEERVLILEEYHKEGHIPQNQPPERGGRVGQDLRKM